LCYDENVLAVAAYAFFFWLGCLRQIEPFHTYFYFFAWLPFLALLAFRIRRRFGHFPVASWRAAAGLALLSATGWCCFELFNVRLNNWSYVGVPSERWMRWTGYFLSFATVWPGILWLGTLLQRRPMSRIFVTPPSSLWSILLGATMLGMAMVRPERYFPLVWGGVFFLLEPLVIRLRGYSLLSDWLGKDFSRTLALLIAGLFCGLFWESSNYWAGAKWIYHLPYGNRWRVFEMPIVGFLGFPAFALEVHSFHEAVQGLWQRTGPAHRAVLIIVAAGICLLTFAAIDRWTVRSFQ
jgi:hypothetical protein